MKIANGTIGVLVGCVLLLSANGITAQDWPQWRGPNREARASGFKAPKTWPKELTKKWQVTVGDGVATPSLVGDKLFVFSRQDGKEILRCLEAGGGKEVWQDSYASEGATGPAQSFSGPRCSPTVADGKVVTLGVRGTLSCFDAGGKKLWRKDDFKSYPRFCTSSSPLVVDGLVIAQLGGTKGGGIIAYDLASGNEKWKWTGDGPSYASPALLSVGDTKVVVAETSGKIVAVGVADGKLLWETDYKTRYNASSPFVDGQTVLYAGSGQGTKAVQLEKKDKVLAAKEVWSNKDSSVMYNTPVVANGLVYGLSDRNSLFCINAKDGKTMWTASLAAGGGGGGGGGRPGRGRMGGGGGYGSIVAAGDVLMALTPAGSLVVFQASDKKFEQLASYKVATQGTYAYPVVSGNRIFVKDRNALTLYTVE